MENVYIMLTLKRKQNKTKKTKHYAMYNMFKGY